MPYTALLAASCAIVSTLFLQAPVFAADKPDAVTVIDADEIVLDRPQSEWSQAYLQWVATFPRGSSPVKSVVRLRAASTIRSDPGPIGSGNGA